MAINRNITGIKVDDGADNGKVPVFNSTTKVFDMTATGGAGATTALDNLASVAINTTLVSDTDNTDDLGTTLKKWANLFVTTIGATATRVTKGWFTDVESTNMPTVGGTPILSSLTAPQFTTIELGHASDTTLSRVSAGVIAVEGVTVPTISSTSTLTNKRITKRVVTTTDDATAVIDVDTTDVYELSAVANATEFTTTGTPTDGQTLMIRLKDAGVAKALTWTGFTAIGVTLPTTTVAGKWHYIGCQYNSAATAWHAIAVGVQA